MISPYTTFDNSSNGLPLGVIELKNPCTEGATLTGVYNGDVPVDVEKLR